MLRPTALDHVGLTVSDMDRSLRFYCDGLGLELLRRLPPRADGASMAVLAVGAQEINVYCDPNGTRGDGAIDHFCLAMEAASAEALVAALRAAGIDVPKEPIVRRSGTSVFVTDPDGIKVELLIKT